MPLPSDRQLHDLIDRIYESAMQPKAWSEVLAGMSEWFGGSPVLGELYIPHGEEPYASVGLQEEFHATFMRDWFQYVPWKSEFDSHFTDRFRPFSETLPDVDLETNDFFLRWMKPQGLAPIWPITITITLDLEVVRMVGGIMVFRRKGEGPFPEEDVRATEVLLPHFHRAMRLRIALDAGKSARVPLAEVLDRLPLGLLVLDRKGNVVMENESASQILALGDGISIGATGVAARDPHENKTLRDAFERAMNPTLELSGDATVFVQVTRPSMKPPYEVMVAPLAFATAGSISEAAAIAFFISDPEAEHVPASKALEEIYALTPAESEIARLLARGLSIDEIADDRNISVNTARSHLKRIYSKTGTSRQSELLALVLTGVGSIRQH